MKYLKYFTIGFITVVLLATLTITISKAAGLYYLQSDSPRGNLASTTSQFKLIGTGATTTIISDGYEQVSYFVALASSTTPPTLCWTNQYSNNSTDWYTTVFSSSTQLTIQSQEVQDCWTYSSTTARNFISTGSDGKTIYLGRKIVVPNLDSVYARIIFVVSGANSQLDIQKVLKNTIIIDK